MSDPIDELSNFDQGVPVNPIPAAEVRRRGERLRRRNTALVVGGAVAAIVLIAVPIAIVSADDDGGTPQPAPPTLTQDGLLTAEELPVRDRLTPWQQIEPDGQINACAPQLPASLDAPVEFRRDFAADVAEAPGSEIPVSVVRTQVLEFDDAADARAAYDQAQGWIFGCPGGDNLAAKGVSVTTFELEDGVGEWRRHDFFAPDICIECDAIRFDRMGIAQFGDRMVLVSLAEVGGPLQPEGLNESMNELYQAAVDKAGGEITGASSEGEASEEPEPEPGALDFPLETGLRSGSEFSTEGPGPDVEGVTLPDGYCGQAAWPPAAPVARLALKVTGPEYAEWRELITFDSADEAAAVVADLRDAVEECPTVAGEQPANDLTFVSHGVDSGYDDATFSYTYREGLGGVVYQFVRVGHAVLATAQYGEWAPETTVPGARELNGSNQPLTALMCKYTEEGC